MCRLAVVVLTVLALIGAGRSAVWIKLLDENPYLPGKCYSANDTMVPLVLDVGFTLIPAPGKGCFAVTCNDKGRDGRYALSFRGCGKAIPNRRCRVVHKSHLQHPDCCPTLKCN